MAPPQKQGFYEFYGIPPTDTWDAFGMIARAGHLEGDAIVGKMFDTLNELGIGGKHNCGLRSDNGPDGPEAPHVRWRHASHGNAKQQ
ncbi:hypothetical protein ASD02_11510 [Ensifer sp. Root1252]|nr:hypothetical protein ASD02_11510 [Ensifer sp. Root1252]KRC74754.1 hypothetical protein ASE32_07595 [Ensifer sp. Root231]KRC94840.1 hypothetical protein ASE47_08585 [Ensifer sp. Root258]